MMNQTTPTSGLENIEHVILVLSGKGGVGKSTVTTQLALTLCKAGKKVGILDVDLCGPSIPRMLNVQDKDVHQCSAGWVPVYADAEQQLSVMSIGFLLGDKDEAVVWRGPKKNAMIKQFLTDVYWGKLDYLIIDTPPGTSDEHITVIENLQELKPEGAVLVTTPQGVAIGDVRREITFCRKTKIPILGIVENMSGFVCPHCAECSNVFSKGGGEALAKQCSVPFLGCIPLDPQLSQSLEEGSSFVDLFPESNTLQALRNIVSMIIKHKESVNL
ncbi:cytosolic Fe-S cluster assembly factor NUBP2 homolog [Anneissia japonica]|uniref:cytosolic Fe-S cluster assembly factor NUBP2 homolog n=1 Tax=Anneissia japonica TaxID=1529436 RepID=UPI0014256C26|nr:cytosolic Fe-S cluster assembly factor NUBP2 homolog [Anneissia japonica]